MIRSMVSGFSPVWRRVVLSTLAGIGVLSVGTIDARAATITVLIENGPAKNNFGGQGCVAPCSAGDPFDNFTLPALGAGVHYDGAGLDKSTTNPGGPYTFVFNFAYDTSTLADVTSATVTIRSGSVGLRDDPPNTGFGLASVRAENGVAPPLNLGSFLTTSTQEVGSPLEETVKDSTFNVLSLILMPGGMLTFTIDGTGINAADQFALDFAELTIEGEAVPDPASSAVLLAIAGVGLAGARRLFGA